MRIGSDSLLWLRAPVSGIAPLCAVAICTIAIGTLAPATMAAAQSLPRARTALTMPLSVTPAASVSTSASTGASVTTDQARAGFRLRSQPLPAFQPIALDVGKFAFTAPGQPAASRPQPAERSFSFTPSRSMKGLSVGITTHGIAARSVAGHVTGVAAAPAPDAGRTAASGVDLALNYRGFQVTGGVSRSDGGVGGLSNESVDVGLGYATGKLRTGITATAERERRMFLSRPGPGEPRYGVEANGLFALSPSVSVGGALRYRVAPSTPTILDPNRDDRAVIVGGAVAF